MSRFAILFWHYKDWRLCRNRLELLRRYNPGVPIWGLYGGPLAEVHEFATALAPLLDDFYSYPHDRSARWKWANGDQLILQWYADRGQHLDFATLLVLQWDVVAFAPVERLFAECPPDRVFLPAVRPVRDVEQVWDRVDEAHPDNRAEYLAFVDQLRRDHGYDREPLCCEFTLAGFPKSFLAALMALGIPAQGWLEYRLPMLAQVLGFELWCGEAFNRPFLFELQAERSAWRRLWNRTMTAGKTPISRTTLFLHMMSPAGFRIFHPVHEPVPLTRPGLLRWYARHAMRELKKGDPPHVIDPAVSVVIRNRNEGRYLERVLAGLAAQDMAHQVIVVDNESTDNSLAVASRAGVQVLSIARGSFTYGRALNLGLRAATGSVCVILSAHALPIGNAFLRECVKPFADPRVAAARCLYAGKQGTRSARSRRSSWTRAPGSNQSSPRVR